MACGVEGDVLGNACAFCPSLHITFYAAGAWQPEDGEASALYGFKEGVCCCGELTDERLLRFLHHHMAIPFTAYLAEIIPRQLSDVADAQACQTAEEEGTADLFVSARCGCQACHLGSIEEVAHQHRTFGNLAPLHVVDGVVGYDFVLHGCVQQALEGVEVVVYADRRQ